MTTSEDVNPVTGIRTLQADLLKAVAATVTSGWLDIRGCQQWSVTVEGTFTNLTLQVLVSNMRDKPDDSLTDAGQIGQDITAPIFVSSSEPTNWMQVSVVATGATGAMSVGFMGRK